MVNRSYLLKVVELHGHFPEEEIDMRSPLHGTDKIGLWKRRENKGEDGLEQRGTKGRERERERGRERGRHRDSESERERERKT